MKKILFAAAIFIVGVVEAQDKIVGQWKTIDDETNKPKSIIEIFEKDGKYSGKIVKLFKEPNEDQNPKCDKCSGEKKDQPIIGMQILNGLKKESELNWSGGEILDPNNGKTYSCKVEIMDNGKKLKLRGFIGFSLLGRTQVWLREGATTAEAVASGASSAAAAPAAAGAATTVMPPETK